MSKYSTAKGIIDATEGTPYYDVMGAEYADEAFLPLPFRVYAKCVPGEPWAMDEEDAACMWAEERWSDYDHPDEMEAIVMHSDGRKWRVTVTVESVPSFHGVSDQVRP